MKMRPSAASDVRLVKKALSLYREDEAGQPAGGGCAEGATPSPAACFSLLSLSSRALLRSVKPATFLRQSLACRNLIRW